MKILPEATINTAALTHYLNQRADDNKSVEGVSSLRAAPAPQGDWDNSSVTSGFRPVGKERVRGDEIEIQGGFKGKEEYEASACAEDDQECERKEVELNRYYVKMCSNRDAQKYVQTMHGMHVPSSYSNNIACSI